MELWFWKFTFGVGFLACCFVDLSWGRPIHSGDGTVANEVNNADIVPIFGANLTVIVVSVIGIVCVVLVLVGCLCCQKGVFKTFESLHNGRFRQGYVSQTSNEFTMFPPGGSSGQQRGSMADIKFEPLPDIRPRGRSLPTAQRPRPATFSNVINRGLSVQDWFDDPHINFPRYQLQYLQELGSGWFGKVVEGEANGIGISPQKTKVVVKILREDATPTDQMYFLHEVKAFRDLSHPNIMKLLGKCLESDPFLIILEHCAFKDLKTYLTQHRTESESLIQGNLLLRMACNIAAGLHHMHSYGFIHTDLAARNCLVNADLQVKIGDYGNAIEKFRENYYCAGDVAVPIRWCAPESLRCTEMTIETKEVTKEANIWSFGVVLWEIIEFGKLPYFELNDDDVLQKVIIDNSTTLGQPRTAVAHKDRVYEVMKLCWLSEPQLRPNMEKVSAMLAHLHNHKDPDLSSEFEQRWNSLQPRAAPHPTRIGAGDASTNLSFESDFEAAPRRLRDWDTSSSMSPVYSLSLEGDFPGTNGSTISPSLQNLRGSMDDINAASSSSVGGGRSLVEQTSVSEGDLNEGGLTHESTPDLKTRSASEDLLQQRRSEEHSPRKVQREFDAWLQQQQSQGAEASQMAQQISEAIGDLDQALASEKSSESSSHHASPERDETLPYERKDDTDDVDVDEEEAERRWTEMVDGTTREAAQVTELVREKSQSVQDFLKLTVIDSDNSDSDINTPRQPPPSSSLPLEDEGVLHNLPTSKLAAFATEVAGASVTAAVREASSPIPRSEIAPSPLLVVATGAASLIPAEAALVGAEMLNGGHGVYSINSRTDLVSETEQSPVLPLFSSAADANDRPPSTNIPVVKEASLTSSQVITHLLDKRRESVECEQIDSTDTSALNNFRLVLNDVATKDLLPAVASNDVNSEDNSTATKVTSSVTSVLHGRDLDGSSPHELTDVSSSDDMHSRLGCLASTPLHTIDESDLSAYFAIRTSDDQMNESAVDDLWAAEDVTTSRENVAVEDVALILDSSSSRSNAHQNHVKPSTESALKLDTDVTHYKDNIALQFDTLPPTLNKSLASGDDCTDSVPRETVLKAEPMFMTAFDNVALTDTVSHTAECNLDEETGERSRFQSPRQLDEITHNNFSVPKTTEYPCLPAVARDFVSPTALDSESSSATMYLTCDDSTQSSQYRTDSDTSATTVDNSSSNECATESVKEIIRPKRFASFDNEDAKQTETTADTLESDTECAADIEDRTELLVSAMTAESILCNVNVTCKDRSKEISDDDTIDINASHLTTDSDCVTNNSSFSESSKRWENMLTPLCSPSDHDSTDKTSEMKPGDIEAESDAEAKNSNPSNDRHDDYETFLCGHHSNSETAASVSSNAALDNIIAEKMSMEAMSLCETTYSPPSDDRHALINSSSDVNGETGVLITFGEVPNDSLTPKEQVDFLLDYDVSRPSASNDEDHLQTCKSQPLFSSDGLLTKKCASVLENDSTIFTTALYLDKKQEGDNETMGLAADQNSLDYKPKVEHEICGTKSDHIEMPSEEERVIASGFAENNFRSQADDGVEGPRNLTEETLVKADVTPFSNVATDCMENVTVDTSSEEEGPQEEARDSLSDGTFERAATPLIEDAFTLDPVVPLELSENSTEDETSVKSSIPEINLLPVAAIELIKPGQESSKLEDDSLVMSPSDTELDVMSGDAETVEFEFFVSADGNGNTNLQSVPCDMKNTILCHTDKLSEETISGIVDINGESRHARLENTFVKFDSDITPENCSDYGTNVEGGSNDKCMPTVVAVDNISNDDEKHSEGSESSGLSTLYEIEDIEEALADVDSSEDDSHPIGEIDNLEETNKTSPSDIQLTKAALIDDDFADFEYPEPEQTNDSFSDWNGNNPLISTWHHNGLHNFVPLHSTIDEVSEEEETISGLADAFQNAFSRIVRRLSEVEMEMVSDENESAVLGITPSPVKELTLSAEALKAVKGGSNGSAFIHDAVNEAMVSCVADMLDNNVVLDDGKLLNIDLKMHELTKDSSPAIVAAKSRDNVVLNNNCRNAVLTQDEDKLANDDVVNANMDILDLSANVANLTLDDNLDNITGIVGKVHYGVDFTNVNHCNTKSETLPETLNSVTIEDLDVPRNGVEKVTFCPASRDDEDDVLIVDTETNEVTLLESNRPRPHLAFVRQSIADVLPFQAKVSSDGEESESEMSSSAAEDMIPSQSKVAGSRFVVVPCIQTGIVVDEELEESSPSLEVGVVVKPVSDLHTDLIPSVSDSSTNDANCNYTCSPSSCKVDTETQADVGCKSEEQCGSTTNRDNEPKNAGTEIAHSALWQNDDDEAQVGVSSSLTNDCADKHILEDGKTHYNSNSTVDAVVVSSELPITSVAKVESNQNSDEILNEEVKLGTDVPAIITVKSDSNDEDSSSLECFLKFASMNTVEHETETIVAAESKETTVAISSSNDENVKATEGIILDVMESDPEDELVALIPVCADTDVPPSLKAADDTKPETATPDVCYTPDWESDTDTSSSQSSSSTSGEFEVNKSTKPSDGSEEFTYSPLTNVLEHHLGDGEDDHSDDELDPETRAALETFQPSEWNKNATPSRGLLRSPEKKLDGKKSVSFKMQKRQVIYEYPKEDKSWDEEQPASRSSWSDQVYDPQMDFTNSIDWELGDEEIPEDIVEVEDFDDGTRSYDPAPVFRLHDDALYRLSNINYEDDACDGGHGGGRNNGDDGGEVVMYDPESGGLTFQQLLQHYGNNPALFGSPPEGEELWPGATLQDSNFFVNCSSDDEDPFKMDPQQFYNAHYFPHYFMDPSHNYFSTSESEPDPRANEGDGAYLGTPESDYMLHRFGPAAAGFHYYDPVMGVNMFVGNGENDESDFAEALDRMIQREQNGGVSHGDIKNDGNNGDDSDSDEIPSFEVKPQKLNAICDMNGLHSTTTTTKTPNELESRNEIGEHSNINLNGIADSPEHGDDLSSEVSIMSSDRTLGKLSPHGTDSGLGTPSIEELPSSPSLIATASSSSVSLDASRTYPAAVELSNKELFI